MGSNRADLGPEGATYGSRRADLRAKRGPSRGGDRRMDKHLEIHPSVLQDIDRPFGAAAQKVSKTLIPFFNLMTLDQWTDG